MKPKATLRHFLALAGSSLMAISSATAADGIWSQTTAGPFDWGVSDNWTDSAIADGTDFTAFFTPNITANQAVNLEADRTIGNITFTDSSSSNNLTISGTGILTLDRETGVPVINVTQSGRALTISSQISGADGLQKDGAGVLLLNGTTSNYSGGTVITGGRLNAASDAALGNSIGSITLNGGTLGANSTTGTGRAGGANLVTARDVIIGASGGSIFVSKNNNFSTTGALSGSGAFTTANPGGAGGIPIYRFSSSANTFTGSMTLNTADVRVSSLGDTAGNNIVFTTADSAFRFNDTGATAGLTFNNRAFELSNVGATIDSLNTTHAFTINSNLVATGAAAKTLTLNSVAGPTNVFAGVIANETDGGTGTVALTKSGAGAWTLSGNNSYTGDTTISAGRLEIGGGGTLGHVSAGVGNYAGNISIASTNSGRLVYNSSANQTLGGVISGAGALFVENGTLTLANDNTYAGGTIINAGTLAVTGATQATSSITFTGGSLGLDTGFPVTAANAAVDLANGTIKVTGSTGASSYTLLTAASITGTPVLAEEVTGYELQVVDGATDDLRLVNTGGASPYDTWSGGAPFGDDANGDGVTNGLAFLLGAATPGANATGLLPTTSQTGGNLVMSFTCLATADRGTATLTLEYDGDLAGTWLSVPVPGAVGAPNPIVENTTTGSVSFQATDGGTNANGDALIDVEATISDATESASGKLFGRLKGTNP